MLFFFILFSVSKCSSVLVSSSSLPFKLQLYLFSNPQKTENLWTWCLEGNSKSSIELLIQKTKQQKKRYRKKRTHVEQGALLYLYIGLNIFWTTLRYLRWNIWKRVLLLSVISGFYLQSTYTVLLTITYTDITYYLLLYPPD